MDNQQLFHELQERFPLVAERISDFSNQLIGEEAGSVDLNRLLTEGCLTLVQMLEDQGIRFHVDDEELLQDFYQARHLINLYEMFIPSKLQSRLQDDRELYKNIEAGLDEVGANEYITRILSIYQQHDESEFARDLYVFFHDKIYSDDLYYQAVNHIFNNASVQDHTTQISNVDQQTTDFAQRLISERVWYQRVTDKALGEELGMSIETTHDLTKSFRLEFAREDRIETFSRFNETVKCNCELALKLLQEVKQTSPHYVEYYQDLGQLTVDHIVAIILTQLSDERLFCIKPNYDKLSQFSTVDVDQLVRKLQYLSQLVDQS